RPTSVWSAYSYPRESHTARVRGRSGFLLRGLVGVGRWIGRLRRIPLVERGDAVDGQFDQVRIILVLDELATHHAWHARKPTRKPPPPCPLVPSMASCRHRAAAGRRPRPSLGPSRPGLPSYHPSLGPCPPCRHDLRAGRLGRSLRASYPPPAAPSPAAAGW